MQEIEEMARELVKTYPFLSDDKAQLFAPEREEIGKCPRCGSPVYEGKKNYYCSNKECRFTMWKGGLRSWTMHCLAMEHISCMSMDSSAI